MCEYNQKNDSPSLDVATVDDFESINISSILNMSSTLNFHTLQMEFRKAAQAAQQSGKSAAERAYNVLTVICSYHFDPGRADVFSPQVIMGDRRTLMPSDYIGEQQNVLAQIAEQIDHPLLRARVADSCWSMNKKLYKMSEVASKSYLVSVDMFLMGKLFYDKESDFEVPSKIVDLIERAFSIYASIGKKKTLPDYAKEIFSKTYEIAKVKLNLIAFHRLSYFGQIYGLLELRLIAEDAKLIAIFTNDNQYPEAVKKVWLHAAYAYLKIGDKDSSTQCKMKAVDQTLRMRDEVGSSMAKASWTREAIGELRSIGGMSNRIDELKVELKQYEEDSLSELGQFSIPIDLSDERQATIEAFEGLPVHGMLYHLAFGSQPLKKVALHRNCLQKKDRYFFSSIMGKSYSDQEGKVIAQSPSAGSEDKPTEEWFDHECLTEVELHYHLEAEAFIKPACITITQHECIDERHLKPIVYYSAFVPAGHEAIFALGFARMIQGDMVSAAHALIPQLENSLRYVLTNRGSGTAKFNVDLTQEDQSLSQMYTNRREELEQIFGEDLTYIFHLLFNLKGGPMLRHNMAHGKLTSHACYSSPCIYACWLMFHITCCPLLSTWKTQIEPAIQEEVQC